ncbi:hypothetical protein NDN08_006119 [Rhodosorus marinus]|uniref:Dolichyl-diphosphooligosaccharide--protein glycosyltransferase subunit OST2 n=1 Tax=Rhodosorus marinus TaxID=101924 RepID=A0AAV8ULC1_9RHOD|nr:hypothetical protein NDN08_006119 [Rhodosorus marinus]
MANLFSVAFEEYKSKIPWKLKVIDAYLVYILLTGIIQFAYCAIVGTFPLNSFLAAFCSSVGSFVLTVSLRMHTNPENKDEFPSHSSLKSFADWLFANLILQVAVLNFLG